MTIHPEILVPGWPIRCMPARILLHGVPGTGKRPLSVNKITGLPPGDFALVTALGVFTRDQDQPLIGFLVDWASSVF